MITYYWDGPLNLRNVGNWNRAITVPLDQERVHFGTPLLTGYMYATPLGMNQVQAFELSDQGTAGRHLLPLCQLASVATT